MAGTGEPTTVKQWQGQFDRWFPRGAYWNPRDDIGHQPMPVAWVYVSELQETQPVTVVFVGGPDRGPWTLTLVSSREMQHTPLLMEFFFAGKDQPVQWTAIGRRDPMAERLVPWRDYYQAKVSGAKVRPPA
jgi:hypothetical protein